MRSRIFSVRAKRKKISPSVRFDVLTASGFACHYCGSRPPEIKLEIEHIIPVTKGGDNDRANLVAACECCNTGKGTKRLSHFPSNRRLAVGKLERNTVIVRWSGRSANGHQFADNCYWNPLEELLNYGALRDGTKIFDWDDQYGKTWYTEHHLAEFRNTWGAEAPCEECGPGSLLCAACDAMED